MKIDVRVNGERHLVEVEPRRLLIDWLRDDLRLTGAKVGCDDGSCGACTILVDSELATPCMLFAVQADGSIIETIEGLSNDSSAVTAQRILMKHYAIQCGFCAPGIVMALVAARRAGVPAQEDKIREQLRGNFCRCTGYVGIVSAALEYLK